MRVLVAPDKFKFALDADGVAAAIVAGVHDAIPDARVTACPLADGGEGTGRILAQHLGATPHATPALDPLGRPRDAAWWRIPDTQTAIIEMAEASGLTLLSEGERDPLHTTSFGVGQLIRAANDAGCTRALLGVGGSATVDGGAGCVQALGWQLVDAYGQPFTEPCRGGWLERIRALWPPERPIQIDIEVLCDVDHRLLGARGAAHVFGPQKGATPDVVEQLERGLAHWANLLRGVAARDVRNDPGAGAAGGLPAGLRAVCGARLVQGFAEVARIVGLREKIAECDLCLTGEGRIDDQTAGGKVVAGVAQLAAAAGVPVVVLVGAAEARPGRTLDDLAAALPARRVVVITPDGTPLDDALGSTGDNLRRAAAAIVRALRG